MSGTSKYGNRIYYEENYFFKFSAFQKQLLELYKNRPNFVTPDFRQNGIKIFVERGLEDFSISRLKRRCLGVYRYQVMTNR